MRVTLPNSTLFRQTDKPKFEIPTESTMIRANLTKLRKLLPIPPMKYSKLPKMRKGDKKSPKKVAFSYGFVV